MIFVLCPNREHKGKQMRAAASLMLIPDLLTPTGSLVASGFRSLNFLQPPSKSPGLAHYLHLQCCSAHTFQPITHLPQMSSYLLKLKMN